MSENEPTALGREERITRYHPLYELVTEALRTSPDIPTLHTGGIAVPLDEAWIVYGAGRIHIAAYTYVLDDQGCPLMSCEIPGGPRCVHRSCEAARSAERVIVWID